MVRSVLFAFFLVAACPHELLAVTWAVSPQPVAPWTQYHQMHGAAVLNGRLYVIGGTTAPGSPPQGEAGAAGDSFSTYRADIVAPGTLSGWTTCTATLPASQANPTDPDYAYINRHVNTHNGRIYITGGNTNRLGGFAERNAVTFCQPAPNGDIPGWIMQPAVGNSIARFEHASVIDNANSRIYVIGGGSTLPRTPQVDFALINADGSIGTWQTAGSLAVGVGQAPAVIRGGKIYVFGGSTGTAETRVVQHATIQFGGTLTAFSTASMQLPVENRFDGAAVVAGNDVYVVGGAVSSDSNTRNTVYKAQFDAAGVITGWTPETPFPASPGLRRMTAVTDGAYIYIPGGRLSATALTPDVFIGALGGSAVGDWLEY